MTWRDVKRRELRDHLVGTARRLVDEHGYSATTVEMIASAAGVSARTVFRHFATKGQLVLDSGYRQQDLLRRTVRAHCASGVSQEALFAALREHLERLESDGDFQMTIRLVRDNPALAAEQAALLVSLAEVVSEELAAVGGRRKPALEDDTYAAIFVGVGQVAITHWSLDGMRRPLRAYLDRQIDLVLSPAT